MMKYETYDELPGDPKEYRKKATATIRAVQIPEGFSVKTMEGWVEGKHGDWLARGIDGELYPINKEVFARTYDEAGDDPPLPERFECIRAFILLGRDPWKDLIPELIGSGPDDINEEMDNTIKVVCEFYRRTEQDFWDEVKEAELDQKERWR